MKGFKGLVQDPGPDEDPEDAVALGDGNQHYKDDYMDEGLEELAVVHGAHTRNEAQHSRGRRIGASRRNSVKGRDLAGGDIGRTLPVSLARIGWCAAGGRHAGLAENLARRRLAHTSGAKRLAAVLAKRLNIRIRVIYAMHGVLRSGIANTFVSIEPVSIRPASLG